MDEEFNGSEEPNLTNKILESILERLDKLESKASKSESSAPVIEQTTSSSSDSATATGSASASNTTTTDTTDSA